MRKLNACLRKGSAEVWRSFTKVVHKHSDYAQGLTQVEEADELLQDIFEDESDHNMVMLGKALLTYPLPKKKKWLIKFTELEPRVGRERAMQQARALGEVSWRVMAAAPHLTWTGDELDADDGYETDVEDEDADDSEDGNAQHAPKYTIQDIDKARRDEAIGAEGEQTSATLR